MSVIHWVKGCVTREAFATATEWLEKKKKHGRSE